MAEQRALKRNLFLLLAIGGFMVAIAQAAGFFFGYGSWRAWWFANLLHTSGGALAFFFARVLFLFTMPRHNTRTVWWMELLMFIAGAMLLGVIWEWYELVIDRYRMFILGLPSLMTYADSIGDLAFDTFGALIAVYMYRKYGKRK